MKKTRNRKNSIYTQKIKPRRYVWHVSRANPLLISRKGLLTNSHRHFGYENAVFAHNDNACETGPNWNWYPLLLDCWDWCFDKSVGFVDSDLEYGYRMESNGYHFWRIDTTIYKGDWFIDTIAHNDFSGYACTDHDFYIVTFNNIPPEALTHYKYHVDERIIYTDSGTYTEGRWRPAAHVTEEKWWWYLLRDDLPV